MSAIRTEVSYKSPYYISKDRYLELKHFCLQYRQFKHDITVECEKMPQNRVFDIYRSRTQMSDKTAVKAVKLAILEHNTDIIDLCSQEAGGDIAQWIFSAVTEGKSYAVLNPPCSKQYFYLRYRAFFWLLDKRR